MPRGRTKHPAKREAILDATRDLCMRGDPHDVTVEQIIKAAGVSKTTFYFSFQDIEATLEAVIRRKSERIASESLLTESVKDDLGATLTSIGDRMLDLLTGPAMGGFDRFVADVAQTRPELAKRFYDAGPGRSHAILTESSEAQALAGAARKAGVEVATGLQALTSPAVQRATEPRCSRSGARSVRRRPVSCVPVGRASHPTGKETAHGRRS